MEKNEETQMWKNNATQQTHHPIARVTAMLEKPKKQDGTY